MSDKRIRILGLTAAAGLLLTGMTAVPASADPPCGSGQVCLYRGAARIKTLYQPVRYGSCVFNDGGAAYDRVVNNTLTFQRAWSGTNCTGASVGVPAGESRTVGYYWSIGG